MIVRSSSLALLIAAIASCTSTGQGQTETTEAQAATIITAPVSETAAPESIAKEPVKPIVPERAEFSLASDPVQGAVIVGQAPSFAKSVTLNGKSLELGADGFFLMGFDRNAENSASLIATLENGEKVEKYLPVRPGNWKIEHVNANKRGGARTSAEFKRRRGPELAQIVGARAQRNDSDGWRQNFIWPVKGRLSGFFGAQRIYRGTPGSYHSGMDIAVPRGTRFVAPADGVVILAARSPFTLEGKLLMIDHGMGLNSAFLHCNELLVSKGDIVKQGQIIGTVGSTGRATGPHLHWGMKWQSARVDPLLLVPAR